MLDQLPSSQAQFLCWNTIFHMPGKRSSCIAFALVVENARIYLNRKKPEKNKCTITVQIFQDKLCNACNCISKYYQICIKTEYKPSKWNIFSCLGCPQNISDDISSYTILKNFGQGRSPHTPLKLATSCKHWILSIFSSLF